MQFEHDSNYKETNAQEHEVGTRVLLDRHINKLVRLGVSSRHCRMVVREGGRRGVCALWRRKTVAVAAAAADKGDAVVGVEGAREGHACHACHRIHLSVGARCCCCCCCWLDVRGAGGVVLLAAAPAAADDAEDGEDQEEAAADHRAEEHGAFEHLRVQGGAAARAAVAAGAARVGFCGSEGFARFAVGLRGRHARLLRRGVTVRRGIHDHTVGERVRACEERARKRKELESVLEIELDMKQKCFQWQLPKFSIEGHRNGSTRDK